MQRAASKAREKSEEVDEDNAIWQGNGEEEKRSRRNRIRKNATEIIVGKVCLTFYS
jgi:hypothetical protein